MSRLTAPSPSSGPDRAPGCPGSPRQVPLDTCPGLESTGPELVPSSGSSLAQLCCAAWENPRVSLAETVASAARRGPLPSDSWAPGQGRSLLLTRALCPERLPSPVLGQFLPLKTWPGCLEVPQVGGLWVPKHSAQSRPRSVLGAWYLLVGRGGDRQVRISAPLLPWCGPTSSHHLHEACSSLGGLFVLRCE